MNMECTIRFIEQLEDEMAACARISCRQLVLSVDHGQRQLTNALMLLGCYLILKQDFTTRYAISSSPFSGVPPMNRHPSAVV